MLYSGQQSSVAGAVESELQYPQTIADALREGTPLRRPGKQEDVGGIAVYFASGASAYRTGRPSCSMASPRPEMSWWQRSAPSHGA